jgi:hypothetical protein
MIWTSKADALIGLVSPELAGENLGVSIEAVLARRSELGTAPYEARMQRHKRGSPKAKATSNPWTEVEVRSPCRCNHDSLLRCCRAALSAPS